MSLTISNLLTQPSQSPLPYNIQSSQPELLTQDNVLPFNPSSGDATTLTKNAYAAVKEVEDIPAQLQEQARKWAKSELSHLLKVLNVTLTTNPSSTYALKDLAKHISSDAKDVAGGLKKGFPKLETPNPVSSQSFSRDTQFSISISDTHTETLSVSTDGKSQKSQLVFSESETETFKIEIEQQNNSALAESANDLNLLGEAAKAINQIKAAIEKATQARRGDLKQAVDGASRDLKNALNSILNDATNSLIALPSDIGLGTDSSVNLTA